MATTSSSLQTSMSWLLQANRSQSQPGMRRFLCEPDGLVLNGSLAYHFSQKLGDLSMYALPLLALAFNSLTLLVFLSNPRLNQSSFSVYIKSMAVSDTLVLLFKLLSYLNKRVKSLYFPSMCTILIFCSEASVLLSIWTIVVITIERTLVVLFPLHTKKLISVCRARALILIIACLTMLFAGRILIIPIDMSPKQSKRCQPMPGWQDYRNLNATIHDFGYCYIPLTIVIIGNCLTLYTVRRAVFRRHHQLTNRSYKQKRQFTDLNEHQLMLMLLMVTVMFIVYFVPFTLTNAMSRWGLPFHLCFTQKAFEVYMICRALSELLKDFNFCTNFIIYCISGRRFRSALVALVKGQTFQSLAISRNLETSRQLNQRLLRTNIRPTNPRLSTRQTLEESQF